MVLREVVVKGCFRGTGPLSRGPDAGADVCSLPITP
jgi:hypothetical protein